MLAEQLEPSAGTCGPSPYRVLGSVEEAQDAVLAGGCGSAARTPRRSRARGGLPTTVVARACLHALPPRSARREVALDSRDLPLVCAGAGSGHSDSQALRADSVGSVLRAVPPTSREPSRRVVEVDLVADLERRCGLDLVMPQR